MTMVPSQNGKQQNNRSGDYAFYSNTTSSAMNQVGVEVEGGYNCILGSDFAVRRHMAEAEESSRPNTTATTTTTTTTHHNNEAEAGGSTSKEEEEGANNDNNNWLQLSIGFHQSSTTKQDLDRTSSMAATTGSGLVELDLLPSRRGLEQPPESFPVVASGRGCQGGGSSFGGSLLFEQTTSSFMSMSTMSMSMASGPITSTFGHQDMMNWAFGPLLPHSMPIMPSSSSFTPLPNYSSSSSSSSCYSSLRPPLGSYFPTPFHPFPSSSGFDQYDVAGAGPSSDITVRVVDPPRRPHSGIWFMLQASQNQAKEPFLPQIPKNYLRIKDGRMTVRLLLKYLVSKLRLESESEIEITCKGQQLLPSLTLQHVRDTIWTPRDTTRALLSDSSTIDHVMVLHYGRSTS